MIKRISSVAYLCAIIVFSMTCTSVAYTPLPADSIRVKWMEGKKFILHKVEPKETWQHLARRYSCSVTDLRAANEGVEQLKVGQIINVPTPGSQASHTEPDSKVKHNDAPIRKPESEPVSNKTVTPVPASDKRNTPIYYTVKKGDTMYSIAKKFNQKVEDVKSANNLSSDVLGENQVLIVGYQTTATIVNKPAENAQSAMATPGAQPVTANIKTEPAMIPPVSKTETGVSPASGYEKPTKSINPVKKGTSGKTLMQVTETGVATWIQDGQLNSDKYYALHRSAPIGTIVKVTNRMNNQFVYVKVVGALPDTGDNDNVIIKVSQAVSSKLVALDPLFQVELSYGMMN